MKNALLLLIGSLLHPIAAQAWVVDTLVDGVDVAPGNGVCATSAGDCSLRAAVQEANASPGPDQIDLDAGIHTLSIPGIDEELAATGDLDLRDEVTIQGAGLDVTVVDAGALDRVFDMPFGSGYGVTIRDLTLTGGEVIDGSGGGIQDRIDGPVLIERVRITDNHDIGDTSNAVAGGVISAGGGTMTIRDSRIDGNSADRAGGIFNNSTLVVERSAISSNDARAGSAMVNYGTTDLEGVLIDDNEATGNSTISQSGSEPLSIVNSTFSGNRDRLYLLSAGSGTVALQNVTMYDNDVPVGVRVFSTSYLEAVNTIFASGAEFNECDIDSASTSYLSLGHNVDRDGTCAGGGAGDLPSQVVWLGPLADNGGPSGTFTHIPLPGSVVIDAGDDSRCPAQDQRDVSRPADGDGNGDATCDIGAVEGVPEPAFALLLGVGTAALATRMRLRPPPQGGC